MPGVNWLEEIEALFLEKSRQSTSLIENLHVPSSGLQTPAQAMEATTMTKRGMMDQFFDIKEQHPDTILFFRMGDFYELFHDDAEVAAEVLGLSLTSAIKMRNNPSQWPVFRGTGWKNIFEPC